MVSIMSPWPADPTNTRFAYELYLNDALINSIQLLVNNVLLAWNKIDIKAPELGAVINYNGVFLI